MITPIDHSPFFDWNRLQFAENRLQNAVIPANCQVSFTISCGLNDRGFGDPSGINQSLHGLIAPGTRPSLQRIRTR
jgi:hypothetical protein